MYIGFRCGPIYLGYEVSAAWSEHPHCLPQPCLLIRPMLDGGDTHHHVKTSVRKRQLTGGTLNGTESVAETLASAG